MKKKIKSFKNNFLLFESMKEAIEKKHAVNSKNLL